MTTAIDEKHGKMVDRLYKQTNAKRLDWTMGENRCPTAKIGEYQVELVWNGDESTPVETVSIKNGYGEFIEAFTDEDLSLLKPSTKGFDGYWPLMEELRHVAFRQAVGADKALDSILGDLDDDL